MERADGPSLIGFFFKYSDDHGATWSDQRYRIPIRKIAIDHQMPGVGGWSVSPPIALCCASGGPPAGLRARATAATADGRYLLWLHNTRSPGGTAIYRPRDVVWLAGGHLQDGVVHWSQPEVILYGFDQAVRGLGMSYPDFIEQDGRLWSTATDKEDARIFEIDPTLLAGLWDQQQRCSVPVEGLAFDVKDSTILRGGSLELGSLPSLLHGGFTIELAFRLDQVRPGQALRLELSDGRHPFEHWTTDIGLLGAGRRHHVTWIIDGGPNLILPVVDGVLGDGGEAARGWGRFSPRLTDVTDHDSTLRIAPQLEGRIEHLRIVRRPLRVTEAIGIHRHDASPCH